VQQERSGRKEFKELREQRAPQVQLERLVQQARRALSVLLDLQEPSALPEQRELREPLARRVQPVRLALQDRLEQLALPAPLEPLARQDQQVRLELLVQQASRLFSMAHGRLALRTRLVKPYFSRDQVTYRSLTRTPDISPTQT